MNIMAIMAVSSIANQKSDHHRRRGSGSGVAAIQHRRRMPAIALQHQPVSMASAAYGIIIVWHQKEEKKSESERRNSGNRNEEINRHQ